MLPSEQEAMNVVIQTVGHIEGTCSISIIRQRVRLF